MPRFINGKRLSAKEERQWSHVFKKTGSGAKAASAVLKSRKSRKKKAKLKKG